MCARIQFQYQGRQVEIRIRPGGAQIEPAATPDVFDARHLFPSDDSQPGGGNPEKVKGGLVKLRAAADQMHAKLAALMLAQPQGVILLTVQCKKGESRSPRCTAAFLKTYFEKSNAEAVAMVETGYDEGNRADGCNQVLRQTLVWNWLSLY
jgi:hypothetical protein